MQGIAGVFRSRAAAEEAVEGLVNHGVRRDSILFLTAEAPIKAQGTENVVEKLEQVPTTDAEADGMGKGMGALMGGGVGASFGLAGGAAVASMLVPGVGTIFAAGLGAAAVLGLAGAAAGAKAGDVSEHSLDTGIPKDDVMAYRDLLKKGHSIVIVNAESEEQASMARFVFETYECEKLPDAAAEDKRAA
jgi:hypothetical protein